MPRTASNVQKRVAVVATADSASSSPVPASAAPAPTRSPGLILVGMGCVAVDLADRSLATADVESARLLVELAMAALHTAGAVAPEIDQAVAATRGQIDRAVAAIKRRERACKSQPLELADSTDADDEWPCRVV